MSSWSEIRKSACDWRAELLRDGGLIRAGTILDAAERATRVRRIALDAGDILLDGGEGVFDGDGRRIFFSKALSPDLANFVIAHEFAHLKLHDVPGACLEDDFDTCAPAEPEASLVGESDAYSPKQRREAQANIFARELLLPRHVLKARCDDRPVNAETLAADLEVPVSLVLQQMADALLLPEEPASEAAKAAPSPDQSQIAAIEAPPGAHQVRAGPGTGKTRTLVGRIARLAKRDSEASILALTYSNASASDLAARVSAAVGAGSIKVWTGTFHAFGLELLRVYGERIGLSPDPKLIDRSEALFLLEELLPQLELDFYLDLREPLRPLKAVVNAISRAKDELCTPQRYLELAQAMKAKPGGAGAVEAAGKAAEVARIYAVYERELRDRKLLDFGDLIVRPLELLREAPDVAEEVRARYPHILVDKYQDMNHASSQLLAELTVAGRGPWVVGDVRQSIYRFRGASPLNMTRFGSMFHEPAFTDLGVNYRSGGRIVRVFERFGASMDCAKLASTTRLKAHEGENEGLVDYDVAATREAEAEGIAAQIRGSLKSGGAAKDHAILGRSHGTLARIAAHLERSSIPCLYFGNFFERPEIRDLLSLLSVVSEPDGLGLMRAGASEPYSVPIEDRLTVLRWRNDEKAPLSAALKRLKEVEALSDAGRKGLERLAADVAHIRFPTRPYDALIRHLFVKGAVFRAPLNEASVQGQQRRLAVYQLLQMALAFRSPAGRDPKREFLAHIRRIEILDEEKDLRRLPSAAGALDAVKVMTVHASKGLEFPIVHIPSLSPSYFPSPARSEPCPAPAGLVEPDPLMSRDAEEDSLFFVALSRGRREVRLSRAAAYGGSSRPNPSRLIKTIEGSLPQRPAPNWTDAGAALPAYDRLAPSDPQSDDLSARDLETYQKCPRRFYYAKGLGLQSREIASPYLRFLSIVREGLRWLRAHQDADTHDLSCWLEQAWQAHGPADAAHGAVYRQHAKSMLTLARRVARGTPLEIERQAPIGRHTISARADNIQEAEGTIVIQRLKAARLAKTERPRLRDLLLQTMVVLDNPGRRVAFDQVSLMDGEERRTLVQGEKLDKSRREAESILANIAGGRFEPTPNDHDCPTCPFFFICPTEGISAGR